MGFLQSKAAVKGYQRQSELLPLIEVILQREGYDCHVKEGTLNEDMKDHIDAKIYCDKNPFLGLFTIPIDIKTGGTFTIYSHTGINNLEATKSEYLVYEKDEDDSFIIFIRISKLREVVKKYPPKIRDGKYDNSKYFWILSYMEEHFEDFGPDDYIIYRK